VKRGEFVRSLVHRGCYLLRHGSRHDIYANPLNGRKAPVPRHPEIRDSLAEMIEKQLGLE
jgi:mRNA interferase HicA